MIRRAWIALGGLGTAAVVALAIAAWVIDSYQEPGPLEHQAAVVIPKGASLTDIANQLADAGVVDDPLVMRIGALLEGAGAALQAGEYAFPKHVSMQDAVAILRSGRTAARRVTIPEGLTVRQIASVLGETEGLDGRLDALPPEGSLLPETYHISLGDKRSDLVARMTESMEQALTEMWASRSPNLPLASPREALILASIVEKESAMPEERPRIAGVFINRLRKAMPLQADPTVVYAVSKGTGRLNRPLTRVDLQVESPYNTYLNNGLPPGPISNPGRASLAAVLTPLETDELYFVADGTGGHAFSRTLEEHNRNVAKWRQFLRQQDHSKP